jgi:hypothetical protein
MSHKLSCSVSQDGIHIRLSERTLFAGARIKPFEDWSAHLPKHIMRALRALLETGGARVDGDALFLDHALAATLPSGLAEQLGLPPLGGFSLALTFFGRIEGKESVIQMRWSDANYSASRAQRTGAFLRIGQQTGRLSKQLYRLAEAIDRFNATPADPIEARVAAWAPIQTALSQAAGQEIAADAYMKSLTFYQAGAFALDIVEGADGPDFFPILMSRENLASLEDDAPAAEIAEEGETGTQADLLDASDALLPTALQKRFTESFSAGSSRTHDAHVLGSNTFVVIDPGLKIALDVVRAKRRAPVSEKRAFIRNPRPAIVDALSAAGQGAASLFIETKQYSDRVEGLGVWTEIRAAPSKDSTNWLPEQFPAEPRDIETLVNEENFDDFCAAVSLAHAADQQSVVFGDAKFLLADAQALINKRKSTPAPARTAALKGEGEETTRIGLVIKNNIDNVEYEIPRKPRTAFIPTAFPYSLLSSNSPKQHQLEGFDWLIESWTKGWPGVLLADDMGLGKTYQALAFLVWARANQRARGERYPTQPSLGPQLVVAPTALLRNWMAEAQTHLADDGLGAPLVAFGAGLKQIKTPKDAGWIEENALDLDRLRAAGWILTTYETLADHHRAFARVPYSVVVFDEIQKIKEPGSINARSSKTINADFVLGLTGTPIENRIEDVWAIFDRIAPGFLGALRQFSSRYGDTGADRLKELKAMLDQPSAELPAPMLRRLKDRARDGLPEKHVNTYRETMPPGQAQAYGKVVSDARAATGARGKMLEILHRMRGVSLHPERAAVDTSDMRSVEAWINGSARLKQGIHTLGDIKRKKEKALVFIEDLLVQEGFAEAAGMIFDLDRRPAIINGGVPGAQRQDIVDRFQRSPPGFDLLVLSPKAAGIGLTITAANHILHLSRWWNPAVEDQCNDRAYRIGARKDVFIHIPLAIHPEIADQSFDVKLHNLLERKRALSRDMLKPPESADDVTALFEGVAGR